MEAALAYSKYMDAVKNHKKAQQERAKHSIHFKTFPAIMDRYEGDLKIAEAAVKEAERQWTAKKALHDAYMKEIISIETAKALASPKAVEPLTDMIKKLIIENVKSQPPQAPDQSLASQIAALREELRAMKRENAQKDATIDVLKSDVKGLTAKIGGIEKLKQDVIEAQELAVSLSGNNSASADSIKEAQERIQDLVDRVNKVSSDNRTLPFTEVLKPRFHKLHPYPPTPLWDLLPRQKKIHLSSQVPIRPTSRLSCCV